jgi:hypothetical protein
MSGLKFVRPHSLFFSKIKCGSVKLAAHQPPTDSKTEDESGYPARLHFRSADLVPAPVFELRLMVRKITKTKTSVRTMLVLDLLKGRPNNFNFCSCGLFSRILFFLES